MLYLINYSINNIILKGVGVAVIIKIQ